MEEATIQAKGEKEFTLQKHCCLIVWVYTLRPSEQLRRYGLTRYVSRKMRYVVIYTNEESIESNVEKINQLHFVRNVNKSYQPDVEMNFAEKIDTKVAYQGQEDDGYAVEELSVEIRLAENV